MVFTDVFYFLFLLISYVNSSLSTLVLNSRDRLGMYGMQHFRTPRNASIMNFKNF